LTNILTSRSLPFALALLIAGCGWGSTPVDRVARAPARYQGRAITVRGNVVWAGFLPQVGSRGFELESEGARLLVLSRRPAPTLGIDLRISGQLEADFDLGDRRAPVLLDDGPLPHVNGGASDVR
jgi:hypothetical protein